MATLSHIIALLVIVSLTSSSVVKSPAEGNNFELLILHDNDMHARFDQTSQLSGVCTSADSEAGKCYGGFARVAHVVKKARAEAASGEGPPVLYLNAGDTYTGTAWFTIYKWKIAAEFINALQPDAICLGNHEFDNGINELTPFIQSVTMPVLASNLNLTKVPELMRENNLQRHFIFEINGVKIGVIGYLTPKTKVIAIHNDVEYIDEIVALKKEVNEIRSIGVNIIIALGHSGYQKDLEIAKEVEGLDLVIGGHSHTFLWNGTAPDTETPEGPYPTYVIQASGKKIPVVQVYAFTKYLGQLHLVFDSKGEIIKLHADPIVMNNNIPQDPEVLYILERYRSALNNYTEQVVGTTSVQLNGSCQHNECNLGNLITDAMVHRYSTDYKGPHWTDSPIALIQAGAIRSSIVHSELPANITKGDLSTVMPFMGHLVVVNMNGSVILDMLEHSISGYHLTSNEKFLQFSGLKVVYDVGMSTGSRVVQVEVRCSECDIPSYSQLIANKTYRIIMPVYIYSGGDGYSMLKDLSTDTLSYNELAATIYYTSHFSPIYAEIEGRVTIIRDTNNNRHKGASTNVLPSFDIAAIVIISKFIT